MPQARCQRQGIHLRDSSSARSRNNSDHLGNRQKHMIQTRSSIAALQVQGKNRALLKGNGTANTILQPLNHSLSGRLTPRSTWSQQVIKGSYLVPQGEEPLPPQDVENDRHVCSRSSRNIY